MATKGKGRTSCSDTGEKLERTAEIQRALNGLLLLSLEDIPLEELLSKALGLILSLPWLIVQSKGGVFLVDEESGSLVMRASSGLDDHVKAACRQVPLGHCHCGIAAVKNEIQQSCSLDERHSICYKDIKPHGHCCVPISRGTTILGVICLYLDEGHTHDKGEVDFLRGAADTLANVVWRKKAEEALKRAHDELEEKIRLRTLELEEKNEALRESEEKFRELFHNANDMMFLYGLTDEGRADFFIEVNSVICRMLGYGREEFLAMSPGDFLPREEADTCVEYNMSLIDRGHDTCETVQITKDGRMIPVEVSAHLFRLRGKKVVLSISRDITERKESEQKLEKTRDEFVHTLVHDLKSPLTAILSYLRLIVDPRFGEICDKKLEFAGLARDSGEILLSMINNIINDARLEAGQVTYHPEDFPLDGLVADLRKAFEGIALLGKVSMEFRCGGGLWVHADRDKVREILFNLLSNALRFTPEGGTVSVTAQLEGDKIAFSVEDTGSGIPEAEQQKIFEKYGQAKGERRGSGLGLYIVKRFLEGQGSDITVKSAPGRGAGFFFSLDKGSPPLESDKKKSFILVAGADDRAASLLSLALPEDSYTIARVKSGKEVIGKVLSSKPECIILYERLPDMEVLKLRSVLKTVHEALGIPVILISSHLLPEWEGQFDAIIPMPLNTHLLREQVEKALGISGRHTP
ncbi:MAG: ATP-binding protein [Candidatus Eremiobacteraeota bacterium]|nr:ATP-binding protein [Candidatus Eremiobacteraeota bacterium]